MSPGRRLVCAALLTAGLGGALSEPATATRAVATTGANAWYQNGYNQGHAGDNPGERALSPATVGRLRPGWTLSTGSMHGVAATTTARVVRGTAYVLGDDETVYAVDSATGRRRWSAHLTGLSTLEQPVLHLGTLVVSAGWYGTASRSSLVGLDAATGRRLWSRAIEPLEVWSAADGSVYLGAWPDGRAPALTSLDVRTGATRWTVTSTEAGDFGWDQTALDGTVLVAQHLHGFRAAIVEGRRTSDGALLWRSALPGPSPVAHGVVIAKHTIYVTYEGNQGRRLRALTEEGRPLWDVPVGSSACDNLNQERPAVAGGLVLLSCGGTMGAYSTATGARRWTARLGLFVTDAVIANGVWYAGWWDVAASQNRLGAFRLTDGGSLWRAATATTPSDLVREEGPAVAEGRVFWSFNNNAMRTFALP